MTTQQVQSRGIFHGLPVFPEHIGGLTAIITGANGISGYHMLRVLAQDSKRWSKIYCLSRRPPAIPEGLPQNAEHIALDFMKKPEEIAETLKEKGIKADYIFFYSYIQPPPKEGQGLWSAAEEMVRVNTILLSNFCEALPLASIKPKRILLQTGAKTYGMHLGPTSVPQEESDPRVTLEPNFYYAQEDYLWDFCAKQSIGWNVVYPSFILGAVPDAAMNVCLPLGIYAAVCAHLGEPLEYPSDLTAWENTQCQSSAMLNAYLMEWAVLTEAALNENFNACDSSAFTWGKFWSKLAGWYSVECGIPDMDPGAYSERTYPHNPPPRGFGPPGKIRNKFVLAEWARQPKVAKAWKELAEQHKLVSNELWDIDRIFPFTDAALSGTHLDMSMDKARKLGWHGTVDSSESIHEVLKEFAKLKMIPPVPA
ncbi:NAD dependent epimerase/dehydratase family protein-like protein [Glonium stellatum]|uniref:NAD dependent epimerase/dehydratase family protein-like protein n=1 Tax=Glonium stellatum TaxID=574774 RepID=A0A8E2JMV1_9PEZI|nr:NAD dependent epimerase/dehydratase family protein-like protein [Glonium stellatum]